MRDVRESTGDSVEFVVGSAFCFHVDELGNHFYDVVFTCFSVASDSDFDLKWIVFKSGNASASALVYDDTARFGNVHGCFLVVGNEEGFDGELFGVVGGDDFAYVFAERSEASTEGIFGTGMKTLRINECFFWHGVDDSNAEAFKAWVYSNDALTLLHGRWYILPGLRRFLRARPLIRRALLRRCH